MTQPRQNSAVELQDLQHRQPEHSASYVSTTEESTTATSLPAADGGLAAWRLLIAAFVFEALLWGQLSAPTQLSSLSNTQANQVSHSASASSKRITPRCLNSKIRLTLPSSAQSHPECPTSPRRSSYLSPNATQSTATL